MNVERDACVRIYVCMQRYTEVARGLKRRKKGEKKNRAGATSAGGPRVASLVEDRNKLGLNQRNSGVEGGPPGVAGPGFGGVVTR